MVSRVRTGIGEEPVEQRPEENHAGADDKDSVDAEGEVGSHGLNTYCVESSKDP